MSSIKEGVIYLFNFQPIFIGYNDKTNTLIYEVKRFGNNIINDIINI